MIALKGSEFRCFYFCFVHLNDIIFCGFFGIYFTGVVHTFVSMAASSSTDVFSVMCNIGNQLPQNKNYHFIIEVYSIIVICY